MKAKKKARASRQRRAPAAPRVEVRYEAAKIGRRTSGWSRNRGDANRVIAAALGELRTQARRLLRDNLYARRARAVIAHNTVGWGITPRVADKTLAAEWKKWANSRFCDHERKRNFAGLQKLVMGTLFSDGEVIVLRRIKDKQLSLQVLEADYLDHAREAETSASGGPIIQGVEFDAEGRPAGYWLFAQHPGSGRTSISRRVDARDVLHIFDPERAGQVRAVSWLAAAIIDLSDFNDFEDAELMKQKIAACFAAFLSETDGPLGLDKGKTAKSQIPVEEFYPGMIVDVGGGKNVTIANPPNIVEGGFASRRLRKVATGLGITYEDFTGDFSLVNFSSARMGRIAHKGYVKHWQYGVLAPQFLDPVLEWFVEVNAFSGKVSTDVADVEWVFPPLEMIDPANEVLANSRRVRNGFASLSTVLREQGDDPEAVLAEYAEDLKQLDEYGIKLDSDVRATSQAGLTQERVGSGGGGGVSSGSNAAPQQDRSIAYLKDLLMEHLGPEKARAAITALNLG